MLLLEAVPGHLEGEGGALEDTRQVTVSGQIETSRDDLGKRFAHLDFWEVTTKAAFMPQNLTLGGVL